MSAPDLRALVRAIAEAAAPHVGARPSQTQHHVARHGPWLAHREQTVALAARAGRWRTKAHGRGPTVAAQSDALDAAAVLALRERLQHQRDERARLLAADDAALRVLDEAARVYDAAAVDEACGVVAAQNGYEVSADGLRHHIRQCLALDAATPPWSRMQVYMAGAGNDIADACDAILRRRAAEAPQGVGQVVLPADVADDGAVTVRVPGREP